MPQFSPNTVVELIDALEFSSYNQLEEFLIRFDMEEANNGGSVADRKLGIIRYLRDNHDKTGPLGANLMVEIIEFLIETRCCNQEPQNVFPRLVRSLTRNGYTLENGNLKAVLPENLQIAETENELTTLLEKFGFSTAKGHLKQAISGHTRGEWASANAMLRSFIESLFDLISERIIDDGITLPPTSHGRREVLTRLNPPFLLGELNEWKSNGQGFVQGFWNRLHPQGSHPGLSDEEDSTFRLYLVIIIGNHYLRRLNTRCGTN